MLQPLSQARTAQFPVLVVRTVLWRLYKHNIYTWMLVLLSSYHDAILPPVATPFVQECKNVWTQSLSCHAFWLIKELLFEFPLAKHHNDLLIYYLSYTDTSSWYSRHVQVVTHVCMTRSSESASANPTRCVKARIEHNVSKSWKWEWVRAHPTNGEAGLFPFFPGSSIHTCMY